MAENLRPSPPLWLYLLLICGGLIPRLHAQGTPLGGPSVAREITLRACPTVSNERTQYAPALYGDQLIFVNRPKRGPTDPVTREVYLQRYGAPILPDGSLGKARPFGTELSGNFNEGPVSFTQDDRVIYFSRNQQRAGGAQPDREGTTNLGIYSAFKSPYGWADIEALPFNNREYSNQQPSMTPDGRRIFFASNRPGGYGGYDLYFSDYFNGRWTLPINLGPEVNTIGNDVFPFYHPSGRLFFASTGHPGQGGLDLFAVDIGGRRWGEVINLPAPLNSPADETGIALTDNARQGYLASNRKGGAGEDDIYRFELRRGLQSLGGTTSVEEMVTVYDETTSARISGARVWVVEISPGGRPDPLYSSLRVEAGGRIEVHPKPLAFLPAPAAITGVAGTARVELAPGKTYEIRVAHPAYREGSLRFIYTNNGANRPLQFVLVPSGCSPVGIRLSTPEGHALRRSVWINPTEACSQLTGRQMTDLLGYVELCTGIPCRAHYLPANAYGSGIIPVISAAYVRKHPLSAVEAPPGNAVETRSGKVGVAIEDYGTDGQAGFASYTVVARPTLAENGVDTQLGQIGEASLELRGLAFAGQTAVLQPKQSPDLELLYQFLLARPTLRLKLAAHTDGPATPASLLRLGEQRAGAVVSYLTDRGISADRLQTVAYGNQFRRESCTACTAAQFARNTWMDARVIEW